MPNVAGEEVEVVDLTEVVVDGHIGLDASPFFITLYNTKMLDCCFNQGEFLLMDEFRDSQKIQLLRKNQNFL